MAEMKEILIFCALYSGVVLSSLALTVTAKAAPVRNRRN